MNLFSSKHATKRKNEALAKSRKKVEDESESESSSEEEEIVETPTDRSEREFEKYDRFQDFGLSASLQASLQSMGLHKPTPVQRRCVPAILRGKDVVAKAQTGSGKTLAFALPILQDLFQDPYGIFAIVIAPTRELAIQTQEQFLSLGASMGIKVGLAIGGQSIVEQRLNLGRCPHVLCATPGRLGHHLDGPDPPDISKARYLVLDEADRLISVGFAEELSRIIEAMSPRRQTLIFSATANKEYEAIESLLSPNNTLFADLTVAAGEAIPKRLKQQYLFVPGRIKLCYLVATLGVLVRPEQEQDGDEPSSSSSNGGRGQKHSKKKRKGGKGDDQVFSSDQAYMCSIIFVDTQSRCDELVAILQTFNLACVGLHAGMTQTAREISLHAFRNRRKVNTLVTTNMAARGLDIPAVDVVVNYDVPRVATEYVHRIGRAARAGRGGLAVTLVTESDVARVHNIEELTHVKMDLFSLVTEDDVLSLLDPVARAVKKASMNLAVQESESSALHGSKKNKRRKNKDIQVG
jgi:ATP-dependent RNA helicase DDX49/DBP8